MSRSLLVLVPPSEGKTSGGAHGAPGGLFDDALLDARGEVRDAVRALLESASSRDLERVLQVRGPLLERARRAMADTVGEAGPTMPVWRRYSGVVWTHLEPSTLHSSARRRLLVPSGLYGINAGSDHIADYRLKMSVRLAPVGRLAEFWRGRISSVLAEHATGRTVVNLLPREHEASIDFTSLARHCHVRHVEFRDLRDGVAVGHDAKAVKGRFARHALVSGVEGLEEFAWRGWHVVAPTRGEDRLTVARD